MLKPLICGTGGFQKEEDELSSCSLSPKSSPVSTPRKSKRSNLCKSHNRDSKNPYSSRGLDKFSALLAELEEKKQKIYSQVGSQDISFVRFVYKNTDDCVPIVVRLKDKNEAEKKLGETKEKSPPVAATRDSEILDKSSIESTAAGDNRVKQMKEELNKVKEKKSFSWNTKLHKLRWPAYYLPAVIVLILLLLVFFGRSAATLYICLAWYIVPTFKRDGREMKKKDHVRKLNENKLISDGLSSLGNNKIGTVTNKSPERRGHRKSW
ncbi:hypothetical protein SLEP1_g21739 [Rubroshorea leprosula]|uniref:ZCF37 n=1 Tax=Rubroshorea leprosula TaxID=152421 RepID=A0AAV5JD18_9ROSI|nr:hypothetical protein SLEP1_g21739 [Rubroshorea leprosula]